MSHVQPLESREGVTSEHQSKSGHQTLTHVSIPMAKSAPFSDISIVAFDTAAPLQAGTSLRKQPCGLFIPLLLPNHALKFISSGHVTTLGNSVLSYGMESHYPNLMDTRPLYCRGCQKKQTFDNEFSDVSRHERMSPPPPLPSSIYQSALKVTMIRLEMPPQTVDPPLHHTAPLHNETPAAGMTSW